MDVIEVDSETAVVRLSREELGALNNALNEVLNGPDAIEDWEFQTRMGVSRDEASSLLGAFHGLPRG